VDLANLKAFDHGTIPDRHLVMTTWHEDEPVDYVFWYSENCACHPAASVDGTVIVHVAPKEERARLLRLYEEAAREEHSRR
jgi:hypothetical protein